LRETEVHAKAYEEKAGRLSLPQARKAVIVLARALRSVIQGLGEIDRSAPQTIWDMTHRQHKVVAFDDVNRVIVRLSRESAIPPPAPRDPQRDALIRIRDSISSDFAAAFIGTAS
jgi:hypothetical protein